MIRPPILMRAAGVVAVLAVTLVALAGCGITTPTANETTFPSTSDGHVYLIDAINLQNFTPASTLPWAVPQSVVLSAVSEPTIPTDPAELELMRLPFVSGSLTATPFMSAPGSERTPASWRAWSDPIPLNGKGPLQPNVTPYGLFNGASSDVKAAGGTYSLGVAYSDSPTHVTAAFYTTIKVNAGSGTWSFATPSGPSAGPTSR